MPNRRTKLTDDTQVIVRTVEHTVQIPDRSLRRDALCVFLNLPEATFARMLANGTIPGPDLDISSQCQLWTAERCLAIRLLLPHWCRLEREGMRLVTRGCEEQDEATA